MSQCHREALAHLLYGLGEGGGFVILTGEVGTGKTTMCRCLLEQVPQNVDLALVFNPKVTSIELIATVCDELGVKYPDKDPSIKTLTDVLNHHLLEAHDRGRRTVLIIDEAQNLNADVLEQIRLLTNLETSTQQLLQIILIGQPELRTLLQRKDLRQLAQRVTARYHLEPVSREDTEAYIEHRLRICGATRPIFSKAAIDRIYKLSGGIPRLINVLCDRALLGAYTEDKLQIDKKIIRQTANELLGDELRQPRIRLRSGWLFGSLVVLVLVLVSTVLYNFWQRPQLADASDQATLQPSQEMSADRRSAEEPPPQTSTAPAANALTEVTSPDSPDTRSESLASALLKANETWSVAAWTALFARWSVKLPAAVAPDYCVFAIDLGLYCLAERGSWGLLRQYNRPVIMELVANNGRLVPVVLQHLDDVEAELLVGNELLSLTVGEVDRHWIGDFTLLLRSPPNRHLLLRAGDRNPDVAWLRQLLEVAQQVKLPTSDPQYFDIPLRQQVLDFQRSRGLTPDGVVGKNTLIQLNTYADANVPVLSDKSF